MMSDNAAMIAWACIKNYKNKKIILDFKTRPKNENYINYKYS